MYVPSWSILVSASWIAFASCGWPFGTTAPSKADAKSPVASEAGTAIAETLPLDTLAS